MEISMEDWEKDVTNIDIDEWLVLEMSEMYSPQLVTETSGTSSVLEGRGGNILFERHSFFCKYYWQWRSEPSYK